MGNARSMPTLKNNYDLHCKPQQKKDNIKCKIKT